MRRRALLGGDDYEAVDLGIISGGKKLLWATKNVGDYGNYYQYGKGSRTYQQTSGETNYRGTENPLASSADTATQVMGGNWRTPTSAECVALTANTTYTWTTVNDVRGGKFTSRSDISKYIFLPAAGCWNNGSFNNGGSYGYYWSSTPNGSGNAYGLVFYSGNKNVSNNYRNRGFSVRGVKEVPLDESDLNGHQFVDLGLPRGTLWATMNVGANSETSYGNYYMYGKGSRTYEQTSGETIYQGTENPLALSADTASQIWGGLWHMPTRAQLNELTLNTTYTWETNFNGSGVNGGKFTSKIDTSKYIFLPAAGYWNNGSFNNGGSYGRYWSSSPSDSNNASFLYFLSGSNYVDFYGGRSYGYSVRPVIG